MNDTSALIHRLGIDARTHLIEPPLIWADHKGNAYKLHEMETSHLVNILRLIVNEWAKRFDLAPVPIRNPQAGLNLKAYRLEQFSSTAKMFCGEVVRRLSTGDELSAGYQVVWGRVVSKVIECLNSGANLLGDGSTSQPLAVRKSQAVDFPEYDEPEYDDDDLSWHPGHPSNYGDN